MGRPALTKPLLLQGSLCYGQAGAHAVFEVARAVFRARIAGIVTDDTLGVAMLAEAGTVHDRELVVVDGHLARGKLTKVDQAAAVAE